MRKSQRQPGFRPAVRIPSVKKADRFRSAPPVRAATECAVLESLAECAKANDSQGSDRQSAFLLSKKRTGLGPHLQSGLRPEYSVLESLAECAKANDSQGSDRQSAFLLSKKRTGLGPHLQSGLRQNVLSLSPWLNAQKPTTARVPTGSLHSFCQKSGQV